MRLLCTGLNHKTAGVALRERLAFDRPAAERALDELSELWPRAEFVILTTCNRTELYVARPVHDHPREEELHLWLGRFQGLGMTEYVSSLYTLADADAIEHLFSVACGLDSMVPGEGEIVAQLKQAFRTAAQRETAGAVMSGLFDAALHVSKRIRTETPIAEGKVSVASVAVECIERRTGSPRGKRVVSVGAGKMNQLIHRRLKDAGAELLVTNRSPDKAQELARACGGRAVPFDRLEEALSEADVLVCSTASPVWIVRARQIRRAMADRPQRSLVIVDLAVPRDVEPSAGEPEGVHLLNIDDLEQVICTTLKTRTRERQAAERTIRRHAKQFRAELNVRDVAPTIRDLYRKMRGIADQELDAAGHKFATHPDAREDMEILRRTLHRTLRRMLNPCTQNLRRAAGSDAARAHVAALRRLFDLDGESGS